MAGISLTSTSATSGHHDGLAPGAGFKLRLQPHVALMLQPAFQGMLGCHQIDVEGARPE